MTYYRIKVLYDANRLCYYESINFQKIWNEKSIDFQ